MQEYEKIFRDFLKRRGLKLTEPRKLILDAAFSVHHHFTVEQLFRLVKAESSLVSLATVYRTLPLLIEAGLLQQSMRSSSRDSFEHILGHPRHIHWICEACGAVIESDLDEVKPIVESDAERFKFELREIKLNVIGLCWKCKQSENNLQ